MRKLFPQFNNNTALVLVRVRLVDGAFIILVLLFALLILSSFHPKNYYVDGDQSSLIWVFNQPKYVSGDTAFFSGYLLSSENKLSTGSQVINIKLIQNEGRVILENRVKFIGGVTSSQFIIPQNLPAGRYFLLSRVENHSSNDQYDLFKTEIIVVGDSAIAYKESPFNEIKVLEKEVLVSDNRKYRRREIVHVGVKLKESEWGSAISSVSVYKEDLFETEGKLNNAIHLTTEQNSMENSTYAPSTVIPYYFKGQIVDSKSGIHLKDQHKIVFYLNRNDFVYSVTTPNNGRFVFPLFKDFGDEEVYYEVFIGGRYIKDVKLVLDEDVLNLTFSESKILSIKDAYGSYARQKAGILKSYKYFHGSKNQQLNSNTEFMQCDLETELGRYEPFQSMEDIFINVVPMVKLRKTRHGGDELKILLSRTATYSQGDPLFIVDGFMTDSTEYVLNLKAESVKKIGVMRTEQTLVRFGELGRNGIIVIETNNPNYEALRKSTKVLAVTGISSSVDFNSPRYDSNNIRSRIPDMRSCLYWNPKLELSNEKETSFSFYTSDDLGVYIIDLFGVTENGKKFFQRNRIRVDE